MPTNDKNRERKFHLYGWVLFLVCAFFFIASGIKGGDFLTVAGSFIFLAGCVVFIIPLVVKNNQGKDG